MFFDSYRCELGPIRKDGLEQRALSLGVSLIMPVLRKARTGEKAERNHDKQGECNQAAD